MSVRVQKVQRVGNSAAVLLPADWVARKGLKPGAKIRVEVTDQKVTIFPEEEEVEVQVDEAYAKLVKGFLRRNKETLKRLAK